MGGLGLVDTDVRAIAPAAKATPQLQLLMEDAFASDRRIWFRGRLRHTLPLSAEAVAEKSWWPFRRGEKPPEPPPLHLQTKIGGLSLESDAAVQPDGRFEVNLTTELPAARRGWRIARSHAAWNEHAADACNVVLSPAPQARGIAVVLLPLEYTFHAGPDRGLTHTDLAARLTRLLHDLEQDEVKAHSFYYLAVVPNDHGKHQTELALAFTSLGWPVGNIVLLPVEREADAGSVFLHGIDRLRWLFAGSLGVCVLNFESSAVSTLATCLQPAEDRAEVTHYLDAIGKDAAEERRLSGRIGAHLDRARLPEGPRPTRSRLVPRYPVVFCHGMLALSTLKMKLPADSNCFAPLRSFLAERGVRALYPQVSPTSGVAERAGQLREQILRWTDEPINLVAHSMGGLDARHLITHLDMGKRVQSLTTISTPHRGTYLADWFIANFRNRVPLLFSLEALGVNMDGFRDCCLETCRVFNEKTPDVAGVRYFSFGGSVTPSHLTPALRRAWNLLIPVEGANDGMVSVASARWGEYLGTLNADHYAQTPDATFVREGENFDALGFYLRVVEDLARSGF